jgi:hypothetical protein
MSFKLFLPRFCLGFGGLFKGLRPRRGADFGGSSNSNAICAGVASGKVVSAKIRNQLLAG